MKPETIDQIVRRKARSRLQAEIGALFDPVRRRLPDGALELPRYHDQAGRRTTARAALDEIQATLIASEVAAYEQRAVEEFIGRHEALQAELDSLKIETKE